MKKGPTFIGFKNLRFYFKLFLFIQEGNKLSLKQQESYLSNLVQLIALRLSWKEAENGEKSENFDSLFEPCWQMFQNRCDRLAVELSNLKLKLDQNTQKGKSTRFCESVIETTAISIVELRKLINLCKDGKINSNIQVKESYLKSAENQMNELAEISVCLVKSIIFGVDGGKVDRFKHFGGKLDPNIFVHRVEQAGEAKIDARELTNVLRVIRRALGQVSEYKDLCYDIRVKAMHAHLLDCRKGIKNLVSNFDEANEITGLEIFGIIEEVQTRDVT